VQVERLKVSDISIYMQLACTKVRPWASLLGDDDSIAAAADDDDDDSEDKN
jgi:hypothetical protein